MASVLMSSSRSPTFRSAIFSSSLPASWSRICCGSLVRNSTRLPRVSAISADTSHPEQAELVVERTMQRFGSIHIVVSSTVPATISPELLFRTPLDRIEQILTGLAVPPMHISRAVLPPMRAQGTGSIVLVASDAAKVATPGESVIGAAMAAIVMFTKAAATECKRDGIRVNAVTPSIISDTPTGQRMLADGFSAKIFGKASALAELGVPTADDVSRGISTA